MENSVKVKVTPRLNEEIPVVKDQYQKFKSDAFFLSHSPYQPVQYAEFWDLSNLERRTIMLKDIRSGSVKMQFLNTGLTLDLVFDSFDFEREIKLVMLKSTPFNINGVGVRWFGEIDLERLSGFACLRYDFEFASKEHLRYYKTSCYLEQKAA